MKFIVEAANNKKFKNMVKEEPKLQELLGELVLTNRYIHFSSNEDMDIVKSHMEYLLESAYGVGDISIIKVGKCYHLVGATQKQRYIVDITIEQLVEFARDYARVIVDDSGYYDYPVLKIYNDYIE